MTIRSHSKQDEIKDREACRVFLGKFSDELFFIVVRELVEIIEELGVDGVNLITRDGNLRKKDVITRLVVGV